MMDRHDPLTYISGSITGTKDFLERFARAEVDLLARGEIPVNPAKVCDQLPKSLEWGEYMQVAYALEHGYGIEEER